VWRRSPFYELSKLAVNGGMNINMIFITKFELHNDDGRLIYDIEAYIGQIEHEFEIGAYTGAILEYESDKCIDMQVVTVSTTQETKPSAQARISVDQVSRSFWQKYRRQV
jgi:hypothetical protein